MNVISYGGGVNSTAMLVGLHQRSIPVDLILFADTGGELPETYAYLPVMDQWLTAHGMPGITVVEYRDKNGGRLTLEQECLRSGTLPALAYGYKKCSLKHKIAPQDKFCNNYPPCREVWDRGEKVVKFIGYDAGEERRRDQALVYDIQDTKYRKEYPLMGAGGLPRGHPGCRTAIAGEIVLFLLPGDEAPGDPHPLPPPPGAVRPGHRH